MKFLEECLSPTGMHLNSWIQIMIRIQEFLKGFICIVRVIYIYFFLSLVIIVIIMFNVILQV